MDVPSPTWESLLPDVGRLFDFGEVVELLEYLDFDVALWLEGLAGVVGGGLGTSVPSRHAHPLIGVGDRLSARSSGH